MDKKAIQKQSINPENYALSAYAESLSEEVVSKSNCKVCQSQHRKDIENEYIKTKSYQDAFDIVKGKNTDIGYHSVRRHLISHFLVQERDLLIKEYAENLSGYLNQKHDKRTQTLERIKMLQKQMYIIGSMTQDANIGEQIKSADAMKKLAEAILVHEKEIELMDREMEPVDLLLVNLKNIIKEKAGQLEKQSNKQFDNDDVMDILTDTWRKLAQSVEGVLVRKG